MHGDAPGIRQDVFSDGDVYALPRVLANNQAAASMARVPIKRREADDTICVIIFSKQGFCSLVPALRADMILMDEPDQESQAHLRHI
jgi:hypothetical protein